ncbi:MAG: hypothetical protein RDV41_07705 [Planctomycetota bacterium]|nr:hypothetical protein [Planctomycetota bacterium]
MKPIHAGLASGRWKELSLAEQMANIASEIGRIISARRRGDGARADGAFDRALELLDLTATDPRWKTGRREITRARELFLAAYFGSSEYNTSLEDLDRYFMQFAAMARRAV